MVLLDKVWPVSDIFIPTLPTRFENPVMFIIIYKKKNTKRVVLIGNKKHFLGFKTNKKIYMCMWELSISVQKKPTQGILR